MINYQAFIENTKGAGFCELLGRVILGQVVACSPGESAEVHVWKAPSVWGPATYPGLALQREWYVYYGAEDTEHIVYNDNEADYVVEMDGYYLITDERGLYLILNHEHLPEKL